MSRKNKIQTLLLICLVGLLIIVGRKYRYGYWESIGAYEWGYFFSTDVVSLPNEKLMFLGCNCPQFVSSIEGSKWNLEHSPSTIYEFDKWVLKNTSSVIYDLKSKKIDKFNIPTDIIYLPYGLLLKNNKLLLTYVYKSSSKKQNDIEANSYDPYTSMAVIDLKTARIEKIIPNKIKKSHTDFYEYTTFTLLGNGNVLIINFKNDTAEIFNPETNTTKLLSIKTHKGLASLVIPYGNSKALILGQTVDSFQDSHSGGNDPLKEYGLETDTILEYDDTTGKCNSIGRVLKRYGVVASVINQSLIIAGGQIDSKSGRIISSNIVEVFDLKNKTSELIGNLKKQRKYSSFSMIPINSRYMLIVGGASGSYPFPYTQQITEIIDLKKNKIFLGSRTIEGTVSPRLFKQTSGDIFAVGDYGQIQKYKVKGLVDE